MCVYGIHANLNSDTPNKDVSMGIAVGFGVVLGLSLCIVFYYYRKNNRKHKYGKTGLECDFQYGMNNNVRQDDFLSDYPQTFSFMI